MKQRLLVMLAILPTYAALAQTIDAEAALIDSIKASFKYQSGTVILRNGLAKLTVPKGFKYLDAVQSKRVIVELWGNPSDITTEGLLFPEKSTPIDEGSFAFNVNYEEMGFVEDKDADEIDYNDLLADMKESTEQESEERIKQGYGSMKLIGWASPPYYDKDRKVLHWAKELQFGDSATHNTLNYDVRLLGRRGVLSMNAIGGIDQLAVVKQNIPAILSSVTFEQGHRYSDFTTGDKVAAVTIGGLVAGKLLAKAGFFALLLKFWKVIAIAVVGGASWIWKRLTGHGTEPA